VPTDALQPIIITNRKRRKRRRLRLGPFFWRALLLVAGIAVLGTGAHRFVAPFTMRHRQKQETAHIRQALAQAEEENRLLKHQIQMLKSGKGLEMEARKLGYVRKGEIPLLITPASEAKASLSH
jgi:cell division protein FtsB